MNYLVPYLRIALLLLLFGVGAQHAPDIFTMFVDNEEAGLLMVFFVIASLGVLSFLSHYLSRQTVFPSFVLAIFFGIVGRDLFAPVVSDSTILGAMVGFGATLILFGGGIEIPFKQFRRLLFRILSLSFIGLFLTALLFSYALQGIAFLFGFTIPTMVVVLLGAVLASTDPAAIIPVLAKLRFKRRSAKDIVISESAITDVVGALLTIVFLTLIHEGGEIPQTIHAAYANLLSQGSLILLLKQVVFGVVFGVLGYLLLEVLLRFKRNHIKETEADAAFFMCVPLLAFVAALTFEGSGYLAAFLAGLLLMMTEHLYETERFFQHMIDGFFKPTIFLLLGALVDPVALAQYAPVGIVVALVFMFIIRPLVVIISLGPFCLLKKNPMNVRDLFFIATVRETGAIPAVLLVTIVSVGASGLEGLVPIGMWVILLTLMIEPPLTPWLARVLDVATPIQDKGGIDLDAPKGEPMVVLASRGYSYGKRIGFVMDWASMHNVRRLLLLCCPEGRYTDELVTYIETHAQKLVDAKNKELVANGKKAIEFIPLIRQGFLQDNIEELITKQSLSISSFFVGRRVLDYRLPQIKRLDVPLFFIE